MYITINPCLGVVGSSQLPARHVKLKWEFNAKAKLSSNGGKKPIRAQLMLRAVHLQGMPGLTLSRGSVHTGGNLKYVGGNLTQVWGWHKDGQTGRSTAHSILLQWKAGIRYFWEVIFPTCAGYGLPYVDCGTWCYWSLYRGPMWVSICSMWVYHANVAVC